MPNQRGHRPTSRKAATLTERIENKEITRRNFIIGGVVAGVAIASASGIYYAVEGDSQIGTTRISVPSANVFGLSDCEQNDDLGQFLKLERTISLPYNTLVGYGSDNIIATLQSSEAGSPLNRAVIIDASNGNSTTALSSTVSSEPRWDIIDFAASKDGCVWIEANLLTDKKRVFTSSSHIASDSPTLVLELDSNWKIPDIIANETVAWIQLSPNDDNSSSTQSELLKINLGENANKIEKVVSTRSFACPPSIAKSGICCCPRDSVYSSSYKLTYLNNSGVEVDCCTLPTSMKPQDVSYGRGHFAFSFTGSYDYGDGISQIGTYNSLTDSQTYEELLAAAKSSERDDEAAQKKSKDLKNTSLSQSTWMQFGRSPLSAPAWSGDLYAIKSTRTVAIFKPDLKQYALIEASDGSDDYGVWLCCNGECDKLVTLTNLDYTPLRGSAIKECRVQIWSAV